MNFKDLFNMSPDLDINVRIKKKNDRLTISVLPATGANVAPVIISGTPEELDEGFISAIQAPITAAQGLQVDDSAFNESVAAAGEKKAGKKPTKEKATEKSASKNSDANEEPSSSVPATAKPSEPSLFD
jgi:PRTRC genetic system protein E